MGYLSCKTFIHFLVLLVSLAVPTCKGDTYFNDVFALNNLYVALGTPPLVGWLPVGGDPCGLGWQGVQCVNSNVTGIMLNGSNLGGELSADLGSFSSMIEIDLSDNQIGGIIPTNLPATIKMLSLSDNQLTGNIPESISSLSQLTDLTLQNNKLTGPIPDAFQQLNGLNTLNLSWNSLSGQLPPSMGNLTALSRLHLQDNQLSGTLDVLQDLHLLDLNIENNLFSGPIPEKLLSIPNFSKAGNPFNTSVLPSPLVSSPSPSPSWAPSPDLAPGQEATGPSMYQPPQTQTRRGGTTMTSKASKSVSWITVAGILAIAVLGLVLCILLSRYCCKRRQVDDKKAKRHETYAYSVPSVTHKVDNSLQKPNYQSETVRKDGVMRPEVKSIWDQERHNLMTNAAEGKQEMDAKRKNSYPELEDYKIDTTGMGSSTILAPPPPPFPLLPSAMVNSDPILPVMTPSRNPLNLSNYVKSFTIASLQQYTDSFSQENLIGKGTLGTVYKAELPTGKTLAVKKLDTGVTRYQTDREFLELVSKIAKLQHENIIHLAGYCTEHRQRILVYEYCENGTLHEALHFGDDLHRKLSWNTRVRLALQAARALEYLHERNHRPIVHQNFKSANILLDDELSVYVSDCGLAPLLSSNSMSELQGSGYGGPELELGSYTYKSDVYSFGVVMLELLTGKKSYDSSCPRGEQFLVRWAIPRLHDIDALSRMVDPSLKGAYSSKSLSRFADIISMCIQPEPEFRPAMSEIVENLLQMVQRDC